MSASTGGIGGLPITPAAECQAPDECPHTYHASGWCSAATGEPVILLVQIECDGANIAVTTIDASTGNVIPNGPVVPCGDKDWEVNQLCDIDPVTGDVIATVTQIFEWDETTGALVIRLERADQPGVDYVPVGDLGTCAPGQLVALAVQVCEDDGGNLRPLTEVLWVDTHDSTVRTVYYLDATGTLTAVAGGAILTVGDCYTSVLPDILSELQEIDDNTDGLETCCAAGNAILQQIEDNTDGVEGLLTAIQGQLITITGHVDGIEGLLTAISGQLTTINTSINSTTYAEDSVHASGALGQFILAVRNDNDIALTSTDGDYSPVAVDAAGRLKTTSIVTATPATSGGASIYRNMDVNATGQVIKGTPGQIYNISARNRANEEIFLKFYNKATAPTAADVPVLVYPIDNNSGSKELETAVSVGFAFSLGIGIRATNGIADADNTNTDLNGMVVNIAFK